MAATWLVILYLAATYIQPQTKIPALQAFRPILVLGVLAIIACVMDIASRRKSVVLNRQMGLMIAFFAFMGLSFTTAYIKLIAYNGWTTFGKMMVLIFFLVNVVDSLPKLRTLVYSLLVVHVAISLEGIKGFYTVTDRKDMKGLDGTLTSFLGDANDFALAVAIIMPLAYFLLPTMKKGPGRMALIGCVVLYGLAVAFTFSRGGFLMMLAIAGYTVLRSARRGPAIATMVAVGLVLLVMLPGAYWSRMQGMSSGGVDMSVQGRFSAWKAGASMAMANPLLGFGPSNFVTGYRMFYRGDTGPEVIAAHSTWFQLMGELGLVGLGIYLYIMWTCWRDLGRVLKQVAQGAFAHSREGPFIAAAARALQASLLAFTVGATFLSAAYYPHMWLIAAMSQALVAAVKPEARALAEARQAIAPPARPRRRWDLGRHQEQTGT